LTSLRARVELRRIRHYGVLPACIRRVERQISTLQELNLRTGVHGLTRARTMRTTRRRTSSPAVWPWRSFTALKSSRSKTTRVTSCLTWSDAWLEDARPLYQDVVELSENGSARAEALESLGCAALQLGETREAIQPWTCVRSARRSARGAAWAGGAPRGLRFG
jgi:hypothetical protein